MENNKKEILLDLYNNLSTLISVSNYSENRVMYEQELSLIKRMNNELEWSCLPEEGKQGKRRATLSMGEKWGLGEQSANKFSYEENVIKLYDDINRILNTDLINNNSLIHIRTILTIEKIFIDEHQSMYSLRHMDYYLWHNLFKSFKDTDENLYDNLNLDALNNTFVNMYKNWPKRPYKEV